MVLFFSFSPPPALSGKIINDILVVVSVDDEIREIAVYITGCKEGKITTVLPFFSSNLMGQNVVLELYH